MNVESIVTTWIQASNGTMPPQADIFFRFIAAWVAFNATYVHRYGATVGDKAGALRFSEELENEEKHRESMAEAGYRSAVQMIAERGVANLKTSRSVTITDVSDFSQVMSAVYQIRCNLFHGGKFPGDPRDQALVGAAHAIITPHLSIRHLRLAA